ncbi:MAG: hypothetical protein KBG48_30710 [Kofleriaceae bacterium]|nr:hypothetical protein [Kofleriaceae bacterium]MBP9171804.1 hypothetical protein [Kofleriaceae bacterium]MBP9861339.1 hypothetical protein [Kofleriaceae bacterium]
MTRIDRSSPLALAAVACASFALAIGVTACVRTTSGPLAQAQPPPAPPPAGIGVGGVGYGASDESFGHGGYGLRGYGDAGYGGASYGTIGIGSGYGGAGYGGYGYGGYGYGGAGYGGAGYGGAPASVDLYACQVDAECTVYFRHDGCFPGDPVGVAVARLADARRLIPVRRDACGMGGPDYERRRLANEGRYSARCERQRCAVVDRGPRRTPF